MKDSSDCPGRFKCHGSASWCDQCGDVDLICDDPKCMAHSRYLEKHERVKLARLAYNEIRAKFRDAEKELLEAERDLKRHETGNSVMVARTK